MPTRGTPRLGVEPDLQHALPTPRPRLGVCTTPNPMRIPRNHPPPIRYNLTHLPRPSTLYLNPPKLTSNSLQTQPQQLQLSQTHSNPNIRTQTIPNSPNYTHCSPCTSATHTLQHHHPRSNSLCHTHPGSRYSTNSMASSSSIVSVFDAHRFRTAHNEQLFDSYARRRKVILEAGFNLEDDEYPEIMEQIALRVGEEEFPYKSFIRGKEVDFSPNNIRRVMRFKRETASALTDYKTCQALNQRLDEVLADLCILGASWKLSSSQPPIPIQLRRTELQPLARGWQEFIIQSLVPTGNKSEITTSRAILIHTIMQGEDVRAEEIIAENMVTITQGLGNKGNLAHPSTIYKLYKDAGVPLREFARTPRIPSLSYITAKSMETIRFSRHQQPQQ
ncbi:hypothetical protein PIB30_086931 [Stylosanthes scabra]|uniref:Putative plant transposon protein domain-containing protein n=1 Tax=Stylosanthes scabra TaxID=79078 RepID=A0ABU6WRL6_9FABA|nr:hypothetical protein [Stylosanthes scabra]